jgi:TonB family protein
MSNTLAQAHDAVPSSDRRLYARQPIRSLAYVELDEGNGGIILNVSEGGLSVQAVTSMMDDLLPGVRFQLSEADGWIEASARITWTGQSRKLAGLEFVDLPEEARGRIREWCIRENENSPAGAIAEVGSPSKDLKPSTDLPHAVEPVVSMSPAAASSVTENRFEEPPPIVSPVRVEQVIKAAPNAGVNESATAEGETIRPTLNSAQESKAEQAPPSPAPRVASGLFSNHGAVAGVLGILAVASLALGWAAGQGVFGKFLQRIRPTAQPDGAIDRGIGSSTAKLAAQVSEIEVVNTNNQRWTIPFDGPLSNSADGVRRPTQANPPSPARKPSVIRTWVLSPPQQTRTAGDDGGLAKENPPVLGEPTNGIEGVLTASGATSSHALAGPPVLRVPEPPPATGVVKQGQLLFRVDPSYPTLARNQRVEGTVRLNVTIAADGSVRGVSVLDGPRLLVDAAEKAVLRWRYSPTFLDAKPVEVQREVDLYFHFTQPAR